MIHEIRLSGYKVKYISGRGTMLFLGTAKSYGIEKLHIYADETWDGMTISATFINGTQRTRMLVDTEGFCDVPPKATEKAATKDHPGRIVISGIKDGVQCVSVDLLYEVKGNSGIDGAASAPTPSEYAQLVLETSENRSAAENAADRAEAAAKRAESAEGVFTQADLEQAVAGYLEENPVEAAPIDTTLTQSGQAADAKAVGDAIANIELTPGPQGEKGDPGADGYTPVKGTDYWTEADKAELVDAVLAKFTDASEVGM